MGLSKATKMLILLGIDTAFFLVEIVVGYSVHSLALVADAFHMVQTPFRYQPSQILTAAA